jgi:hypothetical protein
METIDIQYTMTREDYLKGMRQYTFIRRRWWLPVYIITALLLLYLAACETNNYVNWLILSLYCFLLAYIFVLHPVPSVYRLQKLEFIPDQTSWSFTDKDIRATSKLGESRTTWLLFSKMYVTENYYLLILSSSKANYNIIPGRAFESREQEMAFQEMAKQHIKINT